MQGDSGDATDDEMVSRKTRSCKEGLYRNGPEFDSIDQEDPGGILRDFCNPEKAKSTDICSIYHASYGQIIFFRSSVWTKQRYYIKKD